MEPLSDGVSAAFSQVDEAPVSRDDASRPQAVSRKAGRTFRKDPIIPTTWKVGMVVGLIFAVTLAVLAILVAKGTLHLPSMAASGVKYGAIITGGAQLLALPFLAIHYSKEKKRRGLAERLKEAGGESAEVNSPAAPTGIDPSPPPNRASSPAPSMRRSPPPSAASPSEAGKEPRGRERERNPPRSRARSPTPDPRVAARAGVRSTDDEVRLLDEWLRRLAPEEAAGRSSQAGGPAYESAHAAGGPTIEQVE